MSRQAGSGIEMFDVAIIGAGVVGALVAHRLSKYRVSACLIDRYPEPGCGASKANSAIVHAGYDAKEGTNKARFNVLGCAMMEETCAELDVPFKGIGSLVVAFDERDMQTLSELLRRGRQNGVDGLKIIGRSEVLEMEPNLNPSVLSALYAPSAGIVSPFELACAAAQNAVDNGVVGKFGFYVKRVEKEDNCFRIFSDCGEILSRYLVNCAGVYADDFCALPDFKIRPRKGQYLLVDKKYGSTVSRVIFQPSTEKGKGILVAPTVHHNLLLGPTSEPVLDKEDTQTDAEGLGRIKKEVLRMLPGLDFGGVITSFAGVRAAPNTGDFLVGRSKNWPGLVNAAGIESPGLTAAPAIACHVVELLREEGLVLERKDEKILKRRQKVVRMSCLSMKEKNELIRKNPAYGRIVCRCEGISEGEIVDAIRASAGARTLDGIKRRVRAGMGRCQGGFCTPSVLEILSRELGVTQTKITKNGGQSRLLVDTFKEET